MYGELSIISKIKRVLIPAKFIARPNRFLITAEITPPNEEQPAKNALPEKIPLAQPSQTVSAHLPDPGRLRELLQPGAELLLSPAKNPARKTKFDTLAVRTPTAGIWVSLDSNLPNRLLPQIVKAQLLPALKNKELLKREVKLPNYSSRFDFLLRDQTDNSLTVGEIKSVTLSLEGRGYFPDAPSVRAVKHLRELALASAEYSSLLLFIAQRPDVESVSPAKHIDPLFAQTLHQIKDQIEISALSIELIPDLSKHQLIIAYKREIPVVLD